MRSMRDVDVVWPVGLRVVEGGAKGVGGCWGGGGGSCVRDTHPGKWYKDGGVGNSSICGRKATLQPTSARPQVLAFG